MPDTYVNGVNGDQILIQIGDGASPEVFAHDCMINADRSISLTASTKDQSLPNCTDPSKPDKVVRTVDTLDSTISGNGKLHVTSAYVWADRRGKIVNVRARIAGVLRIAGPYIVSQFDITGVAREVATASITLVQADQPTITADS